MKSLIRPSLRFWALGCCLVGAALAAPTQSRAQTPAPEPTPFVVGVDVQAVSLTVVVYDKGGHFVRGLRPQDIAVYEDGVPQTVEHLREASGGAEKIPLSVTLVLDASGSMTRNLRFLKQAASSFIGKMEDIDSALVVQFNESLKSSAKFTDDRDRLDQFIEGLQAWGGTSLYDAVHYGLNRIRDQPGRKAVIVFSDGADTTSQLRQRDVIDYARAVEATVYSIGIRGAGPGAGLPKGFLKSIAKETGGAYFFPKKVADLIQVFRAISAELHNHYLLSYSPKREPDGSWRSIKVKLDRKDVEVRVRKGYFALKRPRAGASTGR